MRVMQTKFQGAIAPSSELERLRAFEPHLALVFGSVEFFEDPAKVQPLLDALAGTPMIGCSTAGEIDADGVLDGALTVSAMRFDRPGVRIVATDIGDMDDSFAAGERLGAMLTGAGLHSAIVLGQGVRINGSALIDGITRAIGPGVTLSGGLAGDNGAFTRTWTLANGKASDRTIVAMGVYEPAIKITHGSFGGWKPFGPVRHVTRSAGNVLFELDNEPALAVYKRYLGDYASRLPASGLLFPFAMRTSQREEVGIIRTILGIDEAAGSLILAGEIYRDGYLQLMHASTDALVEGATQAAEQARAGMNGAGRNEGLAVLVSCVGRKLAMAGRVDEEVEAVSDTLGRNFAVTGFYSNGEISPDHAGPECHLHNQTMTITLITEQ